MRAGAEPAAIKARKEEAHRAFKAATSAAANRSAVEAAAVAWLDEINRLNSQLRHARAQIKHEQETADRLLEERDRLLDHAEAARAMADSAREQCLSAQRSLAELEKQTAAAASSAPASAAAPAVAPTPAPVATPAAPAAAPAPAAPAAPAGPAPYVPKFNVPGPGFVPKNRRESPPSPPPVVAEIPRSALPTAHPVNDPAPVASPPPKPAAPAGPESYTIDIRSNQPQAIVRLLRRDSHAMAWLVDRLAASNATSRSRWQMLLSVFVDAVIAAAIDDACFEFPPGHEFWESFTPDQAREIARGLAALGFRYDGFGGFVDGRVPQQRDLALAMGSAGLLPVRVRHWPSPEEAALLYTDVLVAADQFISRRSPELAMGDLVKLLGRRAEMLTDLWNDWNRVRALLFTTSLD